MRVLLATMVLLLAGCTSGGGLSEYLLHPGDLPEGCHLVPTSDSEIQELQEWYNLTGNPGHVDNDLFSEDGANVTDNMVAIYACDGGEVYSIALLFASPEEALSYIDGGDCGDDEGFFVDGRVVAFYEVDGTADLDTSVAAGFDRVRTRNHAPDLCETA